MVGRGCDVFDVREMLRRLWLRESALAVATGAASAAIRFASTWSGSRRRPPHARCPESVHCARQAAASNGSVKYCVSSTTRAARNSMMLTVKYGFPS